jgi:hypothetical protein
MDAEIGFRPRPADKPCYDIRTVLFGGLGIGNAILGDTWEWGGSFWTQMDR